VTYDLIQHLKRQRAFTRATFGPGSRQKGVCDHIRKELVEVEDAAHPETEWVDVVLLGLDGLWRALEAAGIEPHKVPSVAAGMIEAKQSANERRDWPDWRTQPVDKAIEHNRVGDAADD